MKVLAIDPGPTESAYVLLDHGGMPIRWEKLPNTALRALLGMHLNDADVLAVEMVGSYGMPVGAEVFETCVWVGRFIERWGGEDFRLIPRTDVKLHLNHSRAAKDSNIRQALIDRFGGKDRAVGKKATPGPLYGLTGDCWSALAVAVTVVDAGAPAA